MKFLATILLVIGALIVFSAPIVEWRYIQVQSAFPDEASGRVYKRVVRGGSVYLTRAEYWLHEGQLAVGILVLAAGGLLYKRAKQGATADA